MFCERGECLSKDSLLLSGIAILPTCILLQLREHWLSIHPEKGWLLRCLGLILQPLLAV